MNTLYINNCGCVNIDENGKVVPTISQREAIRSILLLDTDTKIITGMGDDQHEYICKAGDLVITFYEKAFSHDVVVVTCPEWKENLEAYNEEVQKRALEAAKKANINSGNEQKDAVLDGFSNSIGMDSCESSIATPSYDN